MVIFTPQGMVPSWSREGLSNQLVHMNTEVALGKGICTTQVTMSDGATCRSESIYKYTTMKVCSLTAEKEERVTYSLSTRSMKSR